MVDRRAMVIRPAVGEDLMLGLALTGASWGVD